jgi:signal transduction histidine kinase
MLVWSTFGVLTLLTSILSLYFVYVFINKKDVSFKFKLLFFFITASVIIPAIFYLKEFDIPSCEAVDNLNYILYYQGLCLAIFLWILIYGIYKYVKEKTAFKRQILLLIVGIELFLFSFFITGYLSGLIDNFEFEQYGLFGMTFFMVFLAYLIVKFKAFNIKLISAQALVWASVILIGSEFFFIQNNINRILTSITLVITAILGLLIIRSVKKEVFLREQVEGLAQDLEKTNFNLESANSNLEIANEKLKELDELKTEFVSLTTHQIRGPLTALKGYASMILEGDFGEVSSSIKEPVGIIFESSQSLERVVEDFLDISRIEQGKMKYNFAKIDFGELVKNVTEELKPTIAKTKLTFSFDVIGDNFTVNADKEKIKQVILNFIDNSLKYTPSGSVKVFVENVVSNGKKVVRFSVKDTGVGIAKETLPKLFEKFSRAKDANKTNILGTGLGLYVARKMVEAHNGKLWAESEGEGKGSQFYVELEIAE